MSNWTRRYRFSNLKSKPYVLLGVTGFLMALISFIPIKGDALDMNLHDTYIVFTNVSLYGVFATVLLFLWGLYIVANRFMLSRKLTWFHVIGTLAPILAFLVLNSRTWRESGVPRRYYSMTDFPYHSSFFNIGLIYVAIALIPLLAQLMLVINLIAGTVQFFRRPLSENKNRP